MVDLVAGGIDHAGGVTAGADSGVTVAGMIAGDDYAKVLELAIEYNPESSFGTCYLRLLMPRRSLGFVRSSRKACQSPGYGNWLKEGERTCSIRQMHFFHCLRSGDSPAPAMCASGNTGEPTSAIDGSEYLGDRSIETDSGSHYNAVV